MSAVDPAATPPATPATEPSRLPPGSGRRTPYRVCFVCTGNICRSPVAESVFRARVAEAGLSALVEVGSAGTGGWHVGGPADPRAAASLRAAGYPDAHTARQFTAEWFDRLDLVVALDRGHLRALRRLAPSAAHADRVRLLRSYDPQAAADADGADAADAADDVPDPYYGGPEGFDTVLAMVEAAVPGLLDAVREELEETRP